MMAIAVLLFFGVYLLISIVMVITVANVADKLGKNPWLWAGITVFVMYNLVFWDLIPTQIMHKHYCDTEAGFFVYKTPEQWKTENPDLTEDDLKSLVKKAGILWDLPYKPLLSDPKKNVAMINKRIYLDSDKKEYLWYPIPVHKTIYFIADNRDNLKLAELVTFGSGYRNQKDFQALKFWLLKGNCSSSMEDEMQVTGYKKFLKQIIELGE